MRYSFPGEFNKNLEELVMFLAQVSKCYPAEMSDYPQKLMDILKRHSTVIDPVTILNLKSFLFKWVRRTQKSVSVDTIRINYFLSYSTNTSSQVKHYAEIFENISCEFYSGSKWISENFLVTSRSILSF